MGCDIHTTMQVRRDGLWVDAQPFKSDDGYPEVVGGEFIGDRNYRLFTMLAGVRGEIAQPLAANRGLPAGLSDEQVAFHDNGDNHSATHFTLAEVLAYDWTQILEYEGHVSPREYARWKVNGRPESWCGMVGGGNVRHIDNDEMERLITVTAKPRADGSSFPLHDLMYAHGDDLRDRLRAIDGAARGSPYTVVRWSRPYYEAAGELFSAAVPRALRLGAPEDVRFIISFDS